MELELKKSCLDTFASTGAITLTQEETAETIVPDYCPDIARIIKSEGKVFLHSRDLREGRAEAGGTVRLSVLYTPDGEKGLRTLEFAIPFTAQSERFPKCHHLVARVEIAALETRMLNPRKVFTRCKLTVYLTGYQRTQLVFGSDIEAEKRLCLQKRQSQQKLVLLAAISEKDFSFTDELQLSPGRDGAAEVFFSQVRPFVTESKSVGSKLIVKGAFSLSLLYRTTSGQCACYEAELPFSQVMEAEEGCEDAVAEVLLQLTGADIQISSDDPDGRQIAVTLYLHGTAFLYREQEATLLEDLYSTAYHTSYDATPLELTSFRETMLRRQSVREVLEIGVVAESILSMNAVCGAVCVGREGQNSVLRTSVSIRALYLDEGGTALMAERTVEVSCYLELPEDHRVTAEALCTGELQGSIGDRGIEVRFPVDFSIQTEGKIRRAAISTARLEEEAPKDTASAPSLVLRCLQQQESAWDLAKRYHTTIAEILSANELESESEIPHDKLLLIPKKRA